MLFESKTHSGVANLFAIVLSFLSDWLTEFATPSLFGRMSMSLIQFEFGTHSGSMRRFAFGMLFESQTCSGVANQFAIVLSFLSG